MMIEQFLKSYWGYFLELEEQLKNTKRYVEFSRANRKAYSVEYLKLYQAVCSEIDVVGKEIACYITPNFKTKDANVKKWGFEVQKQFSFIKDIKIRFDNELDFSPFLNWIYEQRISTDKNGKKRTNLAIVEDKKAIQWWHTYNDIKHQRVGLITGTNNYTEANQGNLLEAFSALFLLETVFIAFLEKKEGKQIEHEGSQLFRLENPGDLNSKF